MAVRGWALFSLVLVSLISCSQPGANGSSPPALSASSFSPAPPSSTPSGRRAPIVVIVMENHEFSAIVGSGDAPYLNGTLIPSGRLFTGYTAVTHPSLPNYLAMTSGSVQDKTGTDSISAGEIDAPNLFGQLSGASLSWAAFQETMPSTCYTGSTAGSPPGDYALKHDPAMAYLDVATTPLCRNVVPLSRLEPRNLPSFGFVTPNQCHDMHSCPIGDGDDWLRRHVPPLLRSGATVIVTFDEGETTIGGGGRVVTIEVGAGIPAGTVEDAPLNHYSLLAALEDHFGLPRLGMAETARALPL
jgi:hypothetical protein